jgi:hypothetical protein
MASVVPMTILNESAMGAPAPLYGTSPIRNCGSWSSLVGGPTTSRRAMTGIEAISSPNLHGTRGARHFAEEGTTGRADVSGRERSMSSSADGRVFREEAPTGKLESEQLDALRARSLEKSSMFMGAIDGPRPDAVTASHPIPQPPAPRPPTPTSPEFLSKSTAVLVGMPSAPPPPAPAPVFASAPAPAPAAAALAPPAVVVEAPAPPPAPAALERPALAPAVVRSHRRLTTRALAAPRWRVWRQVIKLALLTLVVLCQPWWWNVGDLNARPPPTTTTAAAK